MMLNEFSAKPVMPEEQRHRFLEAVREVGASGSEVALDAALK